MSTAGTIARRLCTFAAVVRARRLGAFVFAMALLLPVFFSPRLALPGATYSYLFVVDVSETVAAGSSLFGIMGAYLGVPVVAVVFAVIASLHGSAADSRTSDDDDIESGRRSARRAR